MSDALDMEDLGAIAGLLTRCGMHHVGVPGWQAKILAEFPSACVKTPMPDVTYKPLHKEGPDDYSAHPY